MKLGVSSYSFHKYMAETGCDHRKVCDLAKEMGFEGIEFIDLIPKEGTKEDALREAREIRLHCEEINLPICAYTVGANFLAEEIEKEVQRLCDQVDIAVELGVSVMRHDATFALPKKEGYGWREGIRDMAPHIRRVTEYAEARGVRTCTENHGYIYQAPERVEELIRTVGHRNYGWLVDMGNFMCADADPTNAVGIAAPYAFHVHAKDFLWKSGALPMPSGFFPTAGRNYLRGTVLGHGVVPVQNCVNVLKNAGYDGWLSLEFEGMEENLPALKASLEYLKSVV